MAWQQVDLDRIEAAIATGVDRVKFADGREVQYRNASIMLAVRTEIKAALAAQASQVNPIPRATRARMRRR